MHAVSRLEIMGSDRGLEDNHSSSETEQGPESMPSLCAS